MAVKAESGLASRGGWRAVVALVAMLAVYASSFFQRAGIPGTVFNELQTDLALSASAVAALGALYTYVYGGMQLVVGFAADRYGGKRALLAGGLVMVVGTLLFPLSHSHTMLYASRLLVAVGGSFMYLSVVKEVDLLFAPQHFPLLMGVTLLGGYTGGIMAMLPLERAVAAFGWRPALLAAGLLTAVALLVAWIVLHGIGGPRHTAPAAPSLRVLWIILRNRQSRPLLISNFINFPIYFVVQTILGKKFLQDFAGLSSAAAASFTMTMIVVAAAAGLFGGVATRLLGGRRRPWLILANLILLLAVLLLLAGVMWGWSGGVFLTGYILLSVSLLAGPAGTATMRDLNDPRYVGLSIATLNGCCYVGAGVVGNAAGFILDRFRGSATVGATGTIYPPEAYICVFLLLAVLGVISTCSILRVPETRGGVLPGDAVAE